MPNFAISRLVLLTATAALGACAAPPESDPVPPGPLETPAPTEPIDLQEASVEPIGEAQDPSVAGLACGFLCAAGGSLACALVADTCLTASVVTVGTTAVPCMIAMAASCLGTLACLGLCSYDSPGLD